MKKLIVKIWLFTIISTQLIVGGASTALAEEPATLCPKLNNLNASIQKQTAQTDASANAVPLADKMVVITEEPLGNADNTTTFICFREITCSITDVIDNKTKPPTTKKKRECKTQFVASGCQGTSTDQITTILSDHKNTDTYTTCERVMVYLSQPGTNLLYYYVGQIYRYVAFLGGLIAVLTIIIAGLLRTTAGDNSDQIGKANAMITKCISGLIVLFLSAIILYVINPNFFVLS